MERLGSELSGVLAKLQGPGMDAAREAVRLDAIASILWGSFFFVLMIAPFAFCIYVIRKKPFGRDTDDVFVPAGLAFGLFLLLFVGMSCCLFNPWTWAAFTNPDAVIASKLLRL